MEPTCALVTADRGLLISNSKRAVTTGELGSTGAGVGLDIIHEQQCGQVRMSYADSLFSWFEQSLSKDCNRVGISFTDNVNNGMSTTVFCTCRSEG